jgi:hypothetical protein
LRQIRIQRLNNSRLNVPTGIRVGERPESQDGVGDYAVGSIQVLAYTFFDDFQGRLGQLDLAHRGMALHRSEVQDECGLGTVTVYQARISYAFPSTKLLKRMSE